tara:strand:- start:381 stop:626 length:246 start_codon:yes stop_codon:yes gene_type:complete
LRRIFFRCLFCGFWRQCAGEHHRNIGIVLQIIILAKRIGGNRHQSLHGYVSQIKQSRVGIIFDKLAGAPIANADDQIIISQ